MEEISKVPPMVGNIVGIYLLIHIYYLGGCVGPPARHRCSALKLSVKSRSLVLNLEVKC